MQKIPPPQQDLDALIARASAEVREYSPVGERRPSSSVGKWFGLLSMAGATAVSLYLAWPWLRYTPDSALREALVMAMEEARREVETWKQERGQLPPTLPSASLSLLVTYQPAGYGYRLAAASGTVRIEMDESGVVIDR